MNCKTNKHCRKPRCTLPSLVGPLKFPEGRGPIAISVPLRYPSGTRGFQRFDFFDAWKKHILTLPETNIAPENRFLEKEIPIGNHHF